MREFEAGKFESGVGKFEFTAGKQEFGGEEIGAWGGNPGIGEENRGLERIALADNQTGKERA